jgi:PAS domain S-box-containing protein
MNNSKFTGRVILGFVGMIVFLLLNAAWSCHNIYRLNEYGRWVVHTHEVLNDLEALQGHLLEAESLQRSYLVTGGDALPQPFAENIAATRRKLERLKILTEDNPTQQARLPSLEKQIEALTAAWSRTPTVRKKQGLDQVQQNVASGQNDPAMSQLQDLIRQMIATEHALLLARENHSVQAYTYSLATGIAAAMLGLIPVVALMWLFNRHERTNQLNTAAIYEQQQLLRATLASVGDAVIATDPDGRVTFLNAVAQQLTGWSSEEASGVALENVFHIVNETSRVPVENPALRALREGTIVGLANHTILISKNGQEQPIDDSAAPIQDGNGRVVGSVLVFRDISERKHAELAQAERTRLIALRADVGTALVSTETSATIVHRCCEALVRHLDAAFARVWTLSDSGKVLELQASAGLYTHLDGPHSRVPVGQYKIGRIASSKQPHLTNAVPDDPNVSDQAWARREGMVAFAGYPLLVEDQVVGVVAMFSRHPLSESVLIELAPLAEGIAQFIHRRRAETRLREQAEWHRTTLTSIGDAVLTTDEEGRVTFLNAVAESLTGWKLAEALGQPVVGVFNIVNEHSGERVANPVEKVLQEGGIVGLANHTILIARGGTRSPIEDSGAPIRDDHGRMRGVVLVFRDVSEKRAAENALRTSEERLSMALDAANLGIWDWDIRTGEVLWNRHHEVIFGYQPGQPQRSYRDFTDRLHPEERVEIEARFQQAMREKNEYRLEHRVVWPDRTTRWVVSIGKYQYDANGQAWRSVGVLMDITERKEGEAREHQLLADAAAANAKFRAFFEQGALFASIVDLDGIILDPNRLFWEGCGFTREQVQGKLFWQGPWWTPSAALVKRIEAAFAEAKAGQTFHAELPFFLAAGRERIMDLTLLPIKDEAGRVLYIAPSGLDITERKRIEHDLRQAEEYLRQSEERFRSFAENGPQMVWSADANGLTQYLNRRWYEYTGLTVEQMADLENLRQVVHPDDYSPMMERWSEAYAAGVPYDCEFRLKRAVDGVYRWFLVRGVPVRDSHGQIVQWIGANADIDDQKRAEEALQESQRFLRSSLDALESHIAVLDEAGFILEVNEAWRRFADQNQFVGSGHGVGTNYLLACGGDSGDCGDELDIAAGIRAVMAGKQERFRLEYPCHSSHEKRWYLMQATRFPSPGPVRVVVAHQNVTERKLAEDALREADRRKDEFLATLAHELRNPLAPIRNGLQLMRVAGNNADAVLQARSIMERQMEQMVRLVDDLMDVNRISQGKLELRKEKLQLTGVINSAVETSRSLIDEMGHEFLITLPKIPIILDADWTRLTQVISNLLNNAAKYTRRGGRIWLNAELQGSEVLISVRDTGIGIAANQLPRIFEMFSQVEPTLERSQGGLGIGLTLVKRLVEMHGGRIEARSAGLGQGSEFLVWLPARREATVPMSQEKTEEADARSTLRILIVDDNRDGAESLAMLLQILGNVTRTSFDGEEAVATALEFRPHVVLLDIGLPKLNGYEACRRIRQQPGGAQLLIIAQTGWGQENDRQRTREAGFDHHFVKPVDMAALMKLIVGWSEAMRK